MTDNVTLSPADRMLAEQACRDLIIKAAALVDGQDYAGFAALFTEDGVLQRPNAEPLQGHAAIIASYSSKPAGRITRHLLSNTLVTLNSDTQAHATSNVLLWAGNTTDPVSQFGRPLQGSQVVGEFEDWLVLTSAGWHIQRREARFILFK